MMTKDDDTADAQSDGISPVGDDSIVEEDVGPGSSVGEYRVQTLLGRGGCAQVFRAIHRGTGEAYALKILHRELVVQKQMIQRFIREAKIASRLRHECIAQVYDIGTLPDGRPFFVMDLLKGDNLSVRVKKYGRLSVREALSYMGPLVSALTAAHEAGLVHRDLKPSNVLVVDGDTRAPVRLLDFGIAKLLYLEPGEESLTTEQQRLGTYQSMAPEQIRGEEVDARTDVYALGVMLMFLITGRYPFHATDPIGYELMHLSAVPPRPSAFAPVSAQVEQVVLKALEKSKEARYPSAQAFLEALQSAVEAEAPRSKKSEQTVQGIAVLVGMAPIAGQEEDEELLTQAATALEPLESFLENEGFRLMLQTSSSLVAVKILPPDAEVREHVRSSMQSAKRVHQEGRRLAGSPSIRVSVRLHVDEVAVKSSAQGDIPVGGRLLESTDWNSSEVDGCQASAVAVKLAALGDKT